MTTTTRFKGNIIFNDGVTDVSAADLTTVDEVNDVLNSYMTKTNFSEEMLQYNDQYLTMFHERYTKTESDEKYALKDEAVNGNFNVDAFIDGYYEAERSASVLCDQYPPKLAAILVDFQIEGNDFIIKFKAEAETEVKSILFHIFDTMNKQVPLILFIDFTKKQGSIYCMADGEKYEFTRTVESDGVKYQTKLASATNIIPPSSLPQIKYSDHLDDTDGFILQYFAAIFINKIQDPFESMLSTMGAFTFLAIQKHQFETGALPF